MEVTVAVAEGQEVVRRGLESMLQSVPSATWRAYETLEELIAHAIENGWAQVCLVSVDTLRGANREVRNRLGRTAVLATVQTGEPADLAMAARASADGYALLPELSVSSLEQALQDVARGRPHLPDEITGFIREREKEGRNGANGTSHRLSPREGEVVDLLVDGLSNKEISRTLGISVHGAKRHVSSILRKLDSPSRSHLVSSVLRGRLWDTPGHPSLSTGSAELG